MMPTQELVDALKESTDLLETAIEMHVWGPDEKPASDCSYMLQVQSNRELLAKVQSL